MSAPWDLYVALAYRPKLCYRSPEPPPSPPNYALTGFIFNVDEPVERLRRRLENPSVDFCAVPSGKTETVINTLILLFRTLNYYVHFKDMTEYMSSVAHDLCWDVADCRDIVRRYVRAREAFTSVRTRNQSHLARHRSHDSDRVRLLCDLVDEYISSKPVYRATPESRHDFFDQTRALWKDMLKEASILDPMRIIEPPCAPVGQDWPAARDRSVDIGLKRPRSRSHRGETTRRGLSPVDSYRPRRDRRSNSPKRNGPRRCSVSRPRSPIRHRSPVRRQRPRRSSSTITQRFPRYGAQHWSPNRPTRYKSPVRGNSNGPRHA